MSAICLVHSRCCVNRTCVINLVNRIAKPGFLLEALLRWREPLGFSCDILSPINGLLLSSSTVSCVLGHE